MRIFPPPLSVTLLPPSMTSFGAVLLKTFAVLVRTMVTGSAPQSKVMTPPFATAATTASPVQLAALPSPITVVGLDTSSACPSAGTVACPSGLPAAGPSCGAGGGGVVDDDPPLLGEPPLFGEPPLLRAPPLFGEPPALVEPPTAPESP